MEDRIVELYKSGLSAVSVSGKVGCSPSKVYSVLRDRGIERRRPFAAKNHPWRRDKTAAMVKGRAKNGIK